MRKKKPDKTAIYCPACGKELAEHELFFGLCKCKHPIGPETDPKEIIDANLNELFDNLNDET